MKIPLRAAGLALVAASVTSMTSCGLVAGDPPTDASEEEFCDTVKDVQDDKNASAEDSADKLAEVGTPEDTPEDARAGFEFMIENASAFDDEEGMTTQEAEEKYGKENIQNALAFFTYAAKTCGIG